jgi:ELWxxDGT repeat protein
MSYRKVQPFVTLLYKSFAISYHPNLIINMKKIYGFMIGLLALGGQVSAQTFTSIDIRPGSSGGFPQGMTSFGGKTFFQAWGDDNTGTELWVTDGTQAGTSMLKDIWAGPGSSNPGSFVSTGTKLFFTASDSLNGSELWVTDGTSAGTVLVSDIWPGSPGSSPSYLTAMNGKLYFSANTPTSGTELWVSDGTGAGTSLLKDINPGLPASGIFGAHVGPGTRNYIYNLALFNNKLWFRADDGVHGIELWSTDGTTAGTTMIEIWPGPGSGDPYAITEFGGKLYMNASDSLHGSELWVSDGTASGTSLLKDINPGTASGGAGDYATFTAYNGKLYFDARTDAEGRELWSTDGTSAGTTMVKDMWAGPGSSQPGQYGLCVYNNKMYFNAADSINHYQLWSSDGTAAGTSLLKVLSPAFNAFPAAFITYNGSMFFEAIDPVNQYQLWVSDGTSGGTHVLSPPIAPNANPVGNTNLYTINNALYMSANFNSIGQELWIYGFPLGITATTGDQSISAYPNPFSASVTISGLLSSEQYTVQVLDITGREFYRAAVSADQNSISMPELSTGVYLMTVSGQSHSQTFKLVKQ